MFEWELALVLDHECLGNFPLARRKVHLLETESNIVAEHFVVTPDVA
jgi:hypothetical protein